MLPSLAESPQSWTVDFAARRAKAREEAAPHRADLERQSGKATALRERLARLRREKGANGQLEALQAELAASDRVAREARGKVEAIEAAVYDLKAVNPNVRTEIDTRSPAEIIEAIERHGAELAAALSRLKQQIEV